MLISFLYRNVNYGTLLIGIILLRNLLALLLLIRIDTNFWNWTMAERSMALRKIVEH